MKRQRCDGRVAIVKKEKGHSAMQTIWSGGKHNGQITWIDYKCDKGHEWTSNSKDRSCIDYKENN